MTTTDVLGRIKTSGGNLYQLFGNGFTDGNETELKIREIGGALQSLGDAIPGQTITELALQCSDGSILTTCKLYDIDAGVIASWRGNERTTWAFTNLDVKGLAIPVRKGMVLKVNTGD